MKLSIGTAQFGLDYGITNETGIVSPEECKKILLLAKESNLLMLDTAPAYGCSESVIGDTGISKEFDIISKVSDLDNATTSLLKTLDSTRVERLYGLLFHNEQDLLSPDADNKFRLIERLKTEGLVKKLGVSFYNPKYASEIIDRYDIDIIQVPANHLDRRFERTGLLLKAKEKGIEVHARSLFLQGLLIQNQKVRPEPFRSDGDIKRYDKALLASGFSALQFALLYLTNVKQIDKAVIGCTSQYQLSEIIKAYKSIFDINFELPDLFSKNERLINPSKW